MNSIGLEERKHLQLEILDSVHCFCISNGIKYSLGYGSLLGAVRHSGFIPWDDDIDLIMIREDYKKFEELFPKILAGRYSLGTISRDPQWPLPFAKVYDIRTVLLEEKASVSPIGVNIDIFPLDHVPNNPVHFFINKAYFKFLRLCCQIKIYKYSNRTSLIKRIILFILKKILRILSVKRIIEAIDKRSKHISKHDYKRVYYWPSSGNSKPFPLSWFTPLSTVLFEKKEYCSLNCKEGYLKSMYGPNYMIPPVEKERVSYHTNEAFWKDI